MGNGDSLVSGVSQAYSQLVWANYLKKTRLRPIIISLREGRKILNYKPVSRELINIFYIHKIECICVLYARLNGWTDWVETQHSYYTYTHVCTCDILAFNSEWFRRKDKKSDLVNYISAIFWVSWFLRSVILTKIICFLVF